MSNRTAGSGEPYWYEWTVGLLRIVELLHPDSDIQSVTLQAHGTKGWDDVIVKRADKRREFYQVKHSRAGQNLTFGGLVTPETGGPSLLESLYSAWVEMELDVSYDACILYTNRDAGKRVGTSEAGTRRPPLLEFMAWLKPVIQQAESLADCKPPPQWADAWAEWILQLKAGTECDRIEFLSAFDIRTSQEGSPQIAAQVLRDLAQTFGISEQLAAPLLHALDHALRDWTASGEPVTVERVLDALALEYQEREEHRAPPPPSPFFQSREPFVHDLERRLTADNSPPVLFLSAEPGSGKTSVLSELANRRAEHRLRGIVGIRYFAFRPITPDSPIIPPDADRYVKASALWFDLLRQMRRGLRGQLRKYNVPVRDEFLDWPQARKHVLRLASQLSQELGRPFVIAIDGIDHAARAQMHDPAGSREFFLSLPGPEELLTLGIRLLIAGQPAENYPQYPEWLRLPSTAVQLVTLGTLTDSDIGMVLEYSAPQFPVEQRFAAIRIIAGVTHGNTLGVVFAAAEAAVCGGADLLRQRLITRSLQSGITAYYGAIWNYCTGQELPELALTLAGTISLSRERVNGALLSSAFPGFDWSQERWGFLLARLGPLLVEESGGFRVRHNDARVFLQGLLAASTAAQRRLIAGGLANHYLKPSSQRQIAHDSLLFLLREAGREVEWPRYFTVLWIMEAAALGIRYDSIEPECVAALKIAASLHDWNLIGQLTCACETLERWRERREGEELGKFGTFEKGTVGFLEAELFVPPLADWDSWVLRRLADDADTLLTSGEDARAKAMLHRWLDEIDLAKICAAIEDAKDDGPRIGDERAMLGQSSRESFERLGVVCRQAEIFVPFGEEDSELGRQASHAFDKGWTETSCTIDGLNSLETRFAGHEPHFLDTIIQASEAFAGRHDWLILKELFVKIATGYERFVKFRPAFAYQAVWWALRSGAATECSQWLEPLEQFKRDGRFPAPLGFTSAIAIAHAWGWIRVEVVIATIGDELLELLELSDSRLEYAASYGVWLRAAAMVGRIEGVLLRSGDDAAREIALPAELEQIATALWDGDVPHQLHTDRWIAGQLASELADLAGQLAGEHLAALLRAANRPLANWPIDYRRDSIWSVLRLAGLVQRQREWIDRWLVSDGWIWSESVSEREYILEKWRPFAEQIGLGGFVDEVHSKLAWCRISYNTERDTTFFAASAFLEQLLLLDPAEWERSGMRLWSWLDAAAGLGCRSDFKDEILKSIAKATLQLGPNALRRLILADEPNRREEYWQYEVKNYTIDAIVGCLQAGVHFAPSAKISLWCLAIAFCRWFRTQDVSSLQKLHEALIESTTNSGERLFVRDAIARLTPSEVIRKSPPEEQTQSNPSDATNEEPSLDGVLRQIENGKACSLRECLRWVREAIRVQGSNRDRNIATILRSLSKGDDYASQWRAYDQRAVQYAVELGRLLSDDQLWTMVETACSQVESGAYWLQPSTDNLNVTFIARTAARGAAALLDGLNLHLAMHEQLISSGPLQLPRSQVVLPADLDTLTWEQGIAHVLCFLLNSCSAEVIASAIQGVHALVEHAPSVIDVLFKIVGEDLWRARWLLNAAELWAAVLPTPVSNSMLEIDRWLNSDSLEHRLQAWIVLTRLAVETHADIPSLPWPEVPQSDVQRAGPPRDILEVEPEIRGLMRISTRHRAASQHMLILEAATGHALPEVRHRTAELLDNLPSERRPKHSWPASIRQHGDTDVGLDDIGLILGQAIDATMPSPPMWFLPRLAQGLLPNEDPWILRYTPIPDEYLSDWPDEKELGGWQEPLRVAETRKKLLLLACDHQVRSDELVLAAHVEVYSDYHDVQLNVWWEQKPLNEGEIRAWQVPRTISARSFCWWLKHWWEPKRGDGEDALTFVPGGFQRLPHSFIEAFPAQTWIRELAWEPSPSNPLIWQHNGVSILRYERLHGQLRDTHNYHVRQPILTRWLVKRDAFSVARDQLGDLRRCDEIEHARNPELR